jgi:hypothetical protein
MPGDWNDLDHAGTVEALDAATTELQKINLALKGVPWDDPLQATRQVLVGKVRALQRRAARLRPPANFARYFLEAAKLRLTPEIFKGICEAAAKDMRHGRD